MNLQAIRMAAQRSSSDLYAGYYPVAHNWANKANGTPLVLDSGHRNADAIGARLVAPVFWSRSTQSAANDTTAQLRVVNGKLTNVMTAGTSMSGHIPTMIGQQVVRIGGTFVCTPGVNPNGTLAGAVTQGGSGAIALPVWDGVPQYYPGLSSAPMNISASSHLVVTRWQWTLEKVCNGGFPVMAQGNFATPLPADGVTPLSVDVQINAAANQTTITLPDGSVHTITDTVTTFNSQSVPLIGAYASRCVIADWEVFQNDPVNDDRMGFLSSYAS